MSQKRKHKPQRTCIGCGEVESKQSLIRIVRTPKGIYVDPTGKLAGRGAYLHPRGICWEKGLPKAVSRSLRTNLNPEDLERLEEYAATLPD